MKLKQWLRFLLLAAPAIFLSGCATSKLWEEGTFARYHEPATPSNLQLFHSRQDNDVLVQYDESRDDNDSIRRRAYWLAKSGEPVVNPHKPRFVSTKHTQELDLIPMVDAFTNAPPGAGLFAVVSANGQDFALYAGEKDQGEYELPVFRDASGRVKQVLLTPLAVTADLTIIGGVIAVCLWPVGWSFTP